MARPTRDTSDSSAKVKVTHAGPVKIIRTMIDRAWRDRSPGKRLIIWDSECRGLTLVVNPTAMRWSYAFRPRGNDPRTGHRQPNREITLGSPSTLSVDDARARTNRLKDRVRAGGDPAAEMKASAEEQRRKLGSTLGRLLDDYAEQFPTRPKMRGAGAPSPAYVAEELAQARLALAAMQVQERAAADLSEADVRRLLAGSNPRARFGALSRFCDWLQDAGHIAANPCALLARSRRPRAPQARAHYLTSDDLARLWRAADRLRKTVWCDIVRFLIAMPCRRGEAARLDWAHLDLQAEEWRQPEHLTKNREPHRLHLHPLALSVLQARHAAAGKPLTGLVFPAPVSGLVIDTWTALKEELSAASGLANWTWHDFRRSFATALGEAGVSEAVADAILNHKQSATRSGVLGVYQRASRWPEQVKAVQHWGRLLAAAIERRQVGAEVVTITAARTG